MKPFTLLQHATNQSFIMASQTSGTILFGFITVFSCLQLLEQAITQMQAKATHSRIARIAAAVFLPAVVTRDGASLGPKIGLPSEVFQAPSLVVTTFVLTQLLLICYLRSIGAGAGGEDDTSCGAGRRFLGRLAKATLLAATATLLAGAVMCLVASGYLGGAAAYVVGGWPHRKK